VICQFFLSLRSKLIEASGLITSFTFGVSFLVVCGPGALWKLLFRVIEACRLVYHT